MSKKTGKILLATASVATVSVLVTIAIKKVLNEKKECEYKNNILIK